MATAEQTAYNEALDKLRAEYDRIQEEEQGRKWPPIPHNLTTFAKAVRQLNAKRDQKAAVLKTDTNDATASETSNDS